MPENNIEISNKKLEVELRVFLLFFLNVFHKG